jgi:hypothetical protein
MNTQPVILPACPHTAGARVRLIMEPGAVLNLPGKTRNDATSMAPKILKTSPAP